MDNVIDLESRRRARSRARAGVPPMLRRLDLAIDRLDPLVQAAEARGQEPAIETELLAISGAVSVGLFDEAAERAERLAERLVAGAAI